MSVPARIVTMAAQSMTEAEYLLRSWIGQVEDKLQEASPQEMQLACEAADLLEKAGSQLRNLQGDQT